MNTMPDRGLYAITPQWYPDERRLLTGVGAALDGGAAVVQFRDKSGDAEWRRHTAGKLRGLCAGYGVPLIINDDIELAKSCGAPGVHLGRDDAGIRTARERLGKHALIGMSCYNEPGRAAAAQGAAYLAFGSMYPSSTKPGAVRCELQTLTRAAALGWPLVAIGGITPENGTMVIRAGADFLAVISAVFEQKDIERAARRFAALWNE